MWPRASCAAAACSATCWPFGGVPNRPSMAEAEVRVGRGGGQGCLVQVHPESAMRFRSASREGKGGVFMGALSPPRASSFL